MGSGTSAFAAGMKLQEFGYEIKIDTPLDALEKDNNEIIQGIGRKKYLGSKFPYRSFNHGPKLSSNQTNDCTSFPYGGLRLVWCATMVP